MLGSGKMVGFVLTKDYDKARAFYEGKLEFEFVSLDQIWTTPNGDKVAWFKDPDGNVLSVSQHQ